MQVENISAKCSRPREGCGLAGDRHPQDLSLHSHFTHPVCAWCWGGGGVGYPGVEVATMGDDQGWVWDLWQARPSPASHMHARAHRATSICAHISACLSSHVHAHSRLQGAILRNCLRKIQVCSELVSALVEISAASMLLKVTPRKLLQSPLATPAIPTMLWVACHPLPLPKPWRMGVTGEWLCWTPRILELPLCHHQPLRRQQVHRRCCSWGSLSAPWGPMLPSPAAVAPPDRGSARGQF